MSNVSTTVMPFNSTVRTWKPTGAEVFQVLTEGFSLIGAHLDEMFAGWAEHTAVNRRCCYRHSDLRATDKGVTLLGRFTLPLVHPAA